MKVVFSLLCSLVLLSWMMPPVNVYQLQFNDLYDNYVDIKSFQGKKIIVAVFDAQNPDRGYLQSLDTLLQKNKNTLMVIAIPVSDLGNTSSEEHVRRLWNDTLQLSFVITKMSKAKKSSGAAQHSLIKWLTTKEENGHLEMEVVYNSELFLISETGRYFAGLKKRVDVNGTLMTDLLAQKVPE